MEKPLTDNPSVGKKPQLAKLLNMWKKIEEKIFRTQRNCKHDYIAVARIWGKTYY